VAEVAEPAPKLSVPAVANLVHEFLTCGRETHHHAAPVRGILLPRGEAGLNETLDEVAGGWQAYPLCLRDLTDAGRPFVRQREERPQLRHRQIELSPERLAGSLHSPREAAVLFQHGVDQVVSGLGHAATSSKRNSGRIPNHFDAIKVFEGVEGID
jgi:hypothetical protein